MKIKKIILGIIFIVVGVILGLNALDITNIPIFFDGWWTLFIIIPCFIGLFESSNKTANLLGLLFGIFLMLCCMDIISFSLIWKLMLPVILVIIGISCIFEDPLNRKINKEMKKISQNMSKDNDYCATFSEQVIKVDDKFNGANLNAIFGSVKFDLTNSVIEEDVIINCSSIFGGIDIKTLEDCIVKVKSNSLFGGVNNKKVNNSNKKKVKTIYINATCLFGGVDIK